MKRKSKYTYSASHEQFKLLLQQKFERTGSKSTQEFNESGGETLERSAEKWNLHGYKFLRQRPVLKYIADFMCKKLMLIIEVDGYTHEFEHQWKLDQNRQIELEDKGFTVLRFKDDEILNDIENVVRSLSSWVLNHPPAPPSKGDTQA